MTFPKKTATMVGGSLLGKAGHVGVQPVTQFKPSLGTGMPISPITAMKRANGVPGMKKGGSVGKQPSAKFVSRKK